MLARATFVVIAVVHLVAQLGWPEGRVASWSQPLLMAALAWVLVSLVPAPVRSVRLVRLTLVALFFSWLGDTLPRFLDGDVAFLAMIGGFLIAQVVYVVAFWPYRERSMLQRPAVVAPYVVLAVALVAVCAEQAGPLVPAVVVYAAALTAMAVLASGLGRLGWIGGAVFMVSDALIAIGAFTDIDVPLRSFAVMATYLAAQALLVAAVVGEVRSERMEPVPVALR